MGIYLSISLYDLVFVNPIRLTESIGKAFTPFRLYQVVYW